MHCSLGNLIGCPHGLVFKVFPPFKKYASTWHQSSFYSFWINHQASYFWAAQRIQTQRLVCTQGGCWKSKGIFLPGWKKRSGGSLLKVETLVAPTSSELSSTTCLFTVLDGLATLMSAGSVACHWADILSPLFFLASPDLSHDYVGHGWTPGVNWYFLVFLLLPYLPPNLNARCIGYPAHCYVFSTQNRIWFIVNAQ